ncbi:hypothetical protein AURDEDRAFT_176375 [Auricularia subglabra TFB-10046 SS5]|uniref:DUF6589 domain-containing protein n=1 Tax=Auricularia subglabra (strain TFB-10046 / SS5) TaxID=717982 RepID=J0D6U3_AURST|nr:hypothetical protein AURDEDRAFT_176375 [Auricularia subglabra TFB-10046 SS5]
MAIRKTEDTWSIDKPSYGNKMDAVLKTNAVLQLMSFLNLKPRVFFQTLFSSDDETIYTRAAQCLSANDGPSPLPKVLLDIWTRFPRVDNARRGLEQAIDPIVRDILERESTAVINCPGLKLRTSNVTLDTMLSTLGSADDGIRALVARLMPNSYKWLLHATSADNRYRARLRKSQAAETAPGDEDSSDDELGDAELDEDLNGRLRPMADDWRPDHPGFSRDPRLAVIFSLSTLAHVRNRATNALPMCLATQMTAHGASTRVCSTFTRLGAASSRRTMDRFRVRISQDAINRGIEAARADARWLGILDNVDLQIRRFQQRVNSRTYMLHITNCALIGCHSSVPEDATAVNPYLSLRGRRAVAGPADIRPTREDDTCLLQAFESRAGSLCLEYWPGAEAWPKRREMKDHIAALMPVCTPLEPEVTRTFPLGVLNTEEGSNKGVLRALELFREHLTMSKEEWGQHLHIMGGDFLTVRNMRNVQYLRQDDVGPVERLETILPQAQLFHFALNAAHMILHEHLGDAMHDPGSLSCHKDRLLHNFDVNKLDYAQTRALIRHSLISRILYCIGHLLGMDSWSQLKDWKPTPEEFSRTISLFVRRFATAKAAEKAQDVGDNVHAHNIFFIIASLRLLEFDSAVSHGDAGRVIRILKYWVFDFRGANKHNYARECAEILLRWQYELNEAQRKMWAASWFVNRWGRPGRFIASDLYLEHLNHDVKVVHLADGSGTHVDNIIEKGSACVEALRDIALQVSAFVGDSYVHRISREKKVVQDLMILFNVCKQGRLAEIDGSGDRFLPEPTKGDAPPRSKVQSTSSKGYARWNGTFGETLNVTTYDPQLGAAALEAEHDGTSVLKGSEFSSRDLGLDDMPQEGSGGVGGSLYLDSVSES